MSHIRSKDTKPEVRLRRELFRLGYRYRLNVKGMDGSPDIVLAKYRTCIFVNGCFWHGHKGCRKFVLPKARIGETVERIRTELEKNRIDYLEEMAERRRKSEEWKEEIRRREMVGRWTVFVN